MAASDNLSPHQFKAQKTMSVQAVGKLEAGDYNGMTMGEMAGDDYARWQIDQGSPTYRDNDAFEKLSTDVEEHGVQQPLSISGGTYYGKPDRTRTPFVDNGHHRYQAAYDTGQSRVPVTGAVKAAKAFAHYTPPDSDY